ncbi:unnamed protein product [Linum tenue]|uniref:Auxin-responsive protein n=1 Tax=Linum tenue TaxID=586396 RepID=A0AAV0KNZ6_9ROSI|nr:unnamed protein product [Linum tenue]
MSSAPPLPEHDYIGGLSSPPPPPPPLMEPSPAKLAASPSSSSSSSEGDDDRRSNSIKETELRLGLPGSQSPERKHQFQSPSSGLSLFGKDIKDATNLVSGAKRGFSDAMNGSSERWGFSVCEKKSEAVDLGKRSGPALNSCVSGSMRKKDVCVGGQEKGKYQASGMNGHSSAPASKAQVVGWPPISSSRKNTMASNSAKNNEEGEGGKLGFGCLYVKVSLDGAPYLRKVDLKTYTNYKGLSSGLEKMFCSFTFGKSTSNESPGQDGLMSEGQSRDLVNGSEYVLTYEDKDGDWMLVGDVPWEMFTETCRRLRIMKGSDAIGLVDAVAAPRETEKCM